MANAPFDPERFQEAMERYLAGDMKVMPVERDFPRVTPFEVRKYEPNKVRPPTFEWPIEEEEVAKLESPANDPPSKALRQIEEKRRRTENKLMDATFIQMLMESMEMRKYITGTPDQVPYQGPGRVKFDVRLHERQIPEAMSTESKVFKAAIKRGLERSMLNALEATSGMGLLKEDWEVLRQSLIEILQEQARLYYRGDVEDDTATITFEIPKMTLSFRMPIDNLRDT